MTYHAGMNGFGPRDCDPHITCDGEGCETIARVSSRDGKPYTWFLDRKPAPGWKMIRVDEPFSRKDYCPSCKARAEGE